MRAAMDLTQIEELLWPKGARKDVWMILDGARDRRIFGMLLESGLERSCLYSGILSPELELAAPYLVQLEYQDRFTRRLILASLGNSWGVFLKCDVGLKALRRHLRELLIVQDPRSQSLVFRYYDPRVLRVYLPACNRSELDTVFGPISAFWVDAENGLGLVKFTLEGLAEARHTPKGGPAG